MTRLSSRSGHARPALHRPVLSWITLNLLVAAFIMAADNLTLWQRSYRTFDGNLVTIAGFGTAFWALLVLILTILGFRWLQKPVLILILCLSAATSYFQDQLGATIDRDMVQNAVTTTFIEARHLVTARFVTSVLVFGVLPSIMVLWVRVHPQPIWRNIWTWGATATAAVALFAAAMLSDYRTYASAIREHRDLQGSFQPGAPLAGVVRYGKMMLKSKQGPVTPLGTDAAKGAMLRGVEKPVVLVILVGETARAASFGIDGYARDTTPELAKRAIINFTDVRSCGTATAVSLPCMFSGFGRDGYSYDKGIGTENLLDVLARAGVTPEWIDNNTGDKDIAKRTGARRITSVNDPAFCRNGECDDGVFQDIVKTFIGQATGDMVLVLHMIGSHGPAYYLRYPPEFERFVPACRSADFSVCTQTEISNAYDNTILYTDHVVARLIDDLATQDAVIPALLYVSDHGESLGENGLYLHGAPYFMAPDVQTRVPMVLWLSDAFQTALGLDRGCIAARSETALSHDNLFHTVLGLMDVETSVRNDRLDLTAGCRGKARQDIGPDKVLGLTKGSR